MTSWTPWRMSPRAQTVRVFGKPVQLIMLRKLSERGKVILPFRKSLERC